METASAPSSIPAVESSRRKGPWPFGRKAISGGFSSAGVHLILAWIAFDALSGTAWALHLKGLVQWSALPNYWGELLTARDIWELLENGGLKEDPLGAWAPMIGFLSLIWVLWAGWRVQASAVNLPARFGPWIWGLAETLLIGIPVMILGYGVSWLLEGIAGAGIQGLGWLNLVGGTLFRLSCVSTVMIQWWLCRLDRAGLEPDHWHLGSPEILLHHLSRSFQRLWSYPLQWAAFILGGVLVRVGLHFLVFLVAWKLGGGSSFRVWIFLALQIGVAGLNAWLLGWILRLTALFWHQDARSSHGLVAFQHGSGDAAVEHEPA